jgi:hypothetical protein
MPTALGRTFLTPLQPRRALAVATPNAVGANPALHLQLHPEHALLHLDVKNAFNTQHRFAFLKEQYERREPEVATGDH